MTAADKLRELLATRPAGPNVEELVRWWRSSGELVAELLIDFAALRDARDGSFAALRREQDARAALRVDLDRYRHAHLDALTRAEAIKLAAASAKAKPEGYYAEPFQPHEWVIDAIQKASIGRGLQGELERDAEPAAPAPRLTCANMSPPWFTGRWRDWHRGHGCAMDDGKPRTPEGQAEIERGGR